MRYITILIDIILLLHVADLFAVIINLFCILTDFTGYRISIGIRTPFCPLSLFELYEKKAVRKTRIVYFMTE